MTCADMFNRRTGEVLRTTRELVESLSVTNAQGSLMVLESNLPVLTLEEEVDIAVLLDDADSQSRQLTDEFYERFRREPIREYFLQFVEQVDEHDKVMVHDLVNFLESLRQTVPDTIINECQSIVSRYRRSLFSFFESYWRLSLVSRLLREKYDASTRVAVFLPEHSEHQIVRLDEIL